MKRDTIIAIVSSIAIISTVAYSGLNYYAVDNLQFRWYKNGEFSFFALSNGKLQVCNTLPFPTTFSGYDADIIYESKKLATFSTVGLGLAPFSSSLLDGKLKRDTTESLTYLLYLDTELSGTDIARFDARQLSVITNLDTQFLGVIPLSITREYSAYEFVSLMNQGDDGFGC